MISTLTCHSWHPHEQVIYEWDISPRIATFSKLFSSTSANNGILAGVQNIFILRVSNKHQQKLKCWCSFENIGIGWMKLLSMCGSWWEPHVGGKFRTCVLEIWRLHAWTGMKGLFNLRTLATTKQTKQILIFASNLFHHKIYFDPISNNKTDQLIWAEMLLQ